MNGPPVPVFRPTMEEFRNFSAYVEFIESAGAHKVGLAKVVPPAGWRPCDPAAYEKLKLKIRSPITQRVSGADGVYEIRNVCKVAAMSVDDYKTLALSEKHSPPNYNSSEELEKCYWEAFPSGGAIYGADTPGSLFDESQKAWNINRLGTILDLVRTTGRKKIEGVTTPYLYFGMWKASFAWHTEDMDLHSINYLHFGRPKFWYVVAPEHGKRFEQVAASIFPDLALRCDAFMRHKTIVLSPDVLKKHDIPYSCVMHEAGEFMITFPYAYHSGFNIGFNCAESTNFANLRWIGVGRKASLCSCRTDAVRIDMAPFVKHFFPDEYAEEVVQTGERLDRPSVDPERSERLLKRAKLFEEERADNKAVALLEPHCCLCRPFVATQLCVRTTVVPERSRRIVRTNCFNKDDHLSAPVCAAEPETDKLISCATCEVVVHRSCYGPSIDESQWQCHRCKMVGEQVVLCALCDTSGSVFLPTTDNRWVHSICALLTSKVRIDLSTWTVTLPDVFEKRYKPKCIYCGSGHGRPVICCFGSCESAFHVPCAQASQGTFEIRDWPELAVGICDGHVERVGSTNKPPLASGDRVIAQCSATKFNYGVVQAVGQAIYCAIDFDDGTFSNGVYLSTLEECECSGQCFGAHQNGSRVKVRWIDKRLYGGIFRQAYQSTSYHILLDSGELIDCMREEVYSVEEVLPESVKRRLRKRAST